MKKKVAVFKPRVATGYRIFRDREWESRIRPVVLEEIGELGTKDKNWLTVSRRVSKEIWNGLEEADRDEYAAEARRVNRGQLTKEEKARYVVGP